MLILALKLSHEKIPNCFLHRDDFGQRFFLMSGFGQIFSAGAKEGMLALGYPLHLNPFLGLAKIPAAIAIWILGAKYSRLRDTA